MAKDKAQKSTLLKELFRAGLYKSSQGKVSRQVTLAALAISIALAALQIHEGLKLNQTLTKLVSLISGASAGDSNFDSIRSMFVYGLPIFALAAGLWFSFRLVNYPKFADFLIAVEAEMAKVSWPSRGELVRSSLVVIFVIFALASILAGYDFLWVFVLKSIGITS